MFVNYIDMAKKDVLDKHNRLIGRPYDFLVKLGGAYPQLIAMVLSRGVFSKQYVVIPWSSVKRLNDCFHLSVVEENLQFKESYKDEEHTSIRGAILDKQVVDTFNRKVVRVNDIHLLKVDKYLRIAHVDVGFRSLVRRLGWERLVDFIVHVTRPRSRYLNREQLISWKFVQPLEVVSKRGILQLNVSHDDLAAIPPADFGEIIDELDPPERAALFRSLDFETQVDVLNELDVEMQKDLMQEMDTQSTIEFLERMDLDEVADLLGELSKQEVKRILSLVSSAKAKKLSSLLKYESDSAGGLMRIVFVRLSPEMTVAEAIEKIRHTNLDIEMIYYAYVLDDEDRLLGMVTFKRLLTSDPSVKIEEIMVDRPISVSVDNSAKEVAFLMDKYDFLAIPVVDGAKTMKGMITIDDILAIAIDDAWGEKPGLL